MIHTSSGKPGTFVVHRGSNGCMVKNITYHGKAAHAGGAPHQGVNALYAANLGLSAVNALRETFKDDDHIRVHPILTAGGVLALTVQAVRANRPRTPMRDVRIDYSKRWQHQHWTALVSAYKASPYFDHYAPRFEPFYTRRYEFLFDYNLRLMETIAELLGLPMPAVSEAYLTADEGDLDLRPKRKEGADFASPPYIQVFSDRLPFTPNLSIADLLFCEGPQSPALLKQCRL